MRAILIVGILAWGAAAQTLTEPPRLIQVIRRLGNDLTPVRGYSDAGAAVEVLGMTSITGPAETWLIEAHNSFAGIEELDKTVRSLTLERTPGDPLDQLPVDALAVSRTLIALYRPAWSYRPDQAIRLFPKARYFLISVYQVRPGAQADFAESVKRRRGLFDSINLDRPEIAYQVISGAPFGTYLFLAPLTSLKSLDEGLAHAPVYFETHTDPAAKAGNQVTGQGEISRTHLLFKVEPLTSYVSDDFASGAPEFWRPKAKAQ